MALVAIELLLNPPSEEQFKKKLYDVAAALGLPVTSWVVGAPTRTIIAIVAKAYGAFVVPILVHAVKSGFLDDAEGDFLTLLAKKVYDVDRRIATRATTTVLVSNAMGGDYDFDVGDVVFRNSTTDVTYRNKAAFSVTPLQQNVPVDVEADVLGSAGNAAPGEIDELVTTALGLSVTNPSSAVAIDEETDTELRERCRDSLGALSPNGPADAYRFVALTQELNGGANVNRVKVLPAPGDSTVTVVVASPGGAPTNTDHDLVEAALLEHAVPETVTLNLQDATATPLSFDITLHVLAAAGLTDEQWEAVVTDTLVDWVNDLPIGGLELTPGSGFVFWRSVIGVIERIQLTTNGPYYVLHAELGSETDTPIGQTEVATLNPLAVNVSVVQVTP